jgi:hypothetical protein
MNRHTPALLVLTAFVCWGCERSHDNAALNNGSMPQNSDASSSRTDPALDDARAMPPQTVTVVGCLEGANTVPPRGTGTAPMTSDQATREAPALTYRLTAARPDSQETAGVGTSGAGASGGPLVSGVSDFELDGLPADGQAAVHKQVRITGHLAAGRSGSPSPNTRVPGATDAVPQGSKPEAAGAAAPDLGHRLVVESVQVVSQSCVAAP